MAEVIEFHNSQVDNPTHASLSAPKEHPVLKLRPFNSFGIAINLSHEL